MTWTVFEQGNVFVRKWKRRETILQIVQAAFAAAGKKLLQIKEEIADTFPRQVHKLYKGDAAT